MTYAPPPGMGVPQKKGTNPLVWIFVALGAFCCIGIIAFGAMTATVFNQTKGMFPCIFSLATLNKSMDAYVKEKGVFPPAENWQDELAPYYSKNSDDMKNELKDAPMGIDEWANVADINGDFSCNTSGTKTFIAYNPDIAGKKVTDIADPAATVMFFETTTTGRNINETYAEKDFSTSPKLMGQPRGWYQMTADGEMVTVDQKGKKTKVDISN